MRHGPTSNNGGTDQGAPRLATLTLAVITEAELAEQLHHAKPEEVLSRHMNGGPLLILPRDHAWPRLLFMPSPNSGEQIESPDHERFKIWEKNNGNTSVRQAAKAEIERLKRDKQIDLLLDENDNIFIKGQNKTDCFKKKTVTYQLIRYLIRNPYGLSFRKVFEKWKEIDSQRVRETEGNKKRRKLRDIKRTIRYINKHLEEAGIRSRLFVPLADRFSISTECRVVALSRERVKS